MSDAVMNSLFGAKFDYPSMADQSSSQLMIASVPRSGSTTFCNDLWNTGVLGAPMEYLNLTWIERNRRWADDLVDIVGYWRKVRSLRTSPNGVFSYKIFVPNYLTLRDKHPALLPLLAPTHVIYFTRKDVVAQAVSYARAIKSQRWFAGKPSATDLEYSKETIDDAHRKILQQKAQWEKLFELTGWQELLRIDYEDYLSDKTAVICDVVRFVTGKAWNGRTLGIPNISVQREITSFQWMEQYISQLDPQKLSC